MRKASFFSPRRTTLFIALLGTVLLFGCGDGGSSSGGSGGTGTAGSGGTGTGGAGGTQASVKTIAEARALADGETATVEGYVTVAPGTFNSATGDQGFAIQDDTGGVYVGISDLLTFKLDEHVRVTGKLSQVSQQTVLAAVAADVSVVDTTTLSVPPKAITTKEVGEGVEGLLVQTSGKVTQAVMDDSPYGKKVYIDDGSGEVQVFVHLVGGQPVVGIDSLVIGDSVSVTGVAGQFETTYEVIPRKSDDLAIAVQ